VGFYEICRGIKLLALMVLLWHFSSIVGRFFRMILWIFLRKFMSRGNLKNLLMQPLSPSSLRSLMP
jgi:hypothetical protein